MLHGSRTSRPVALIAVFVTVVSSVAPFPVSAHLPPDTSPYRVFFADDPDPDADELTILGNGDLRWLESTNVSVEQLARAVDFYYPSTNPGFVVESDQVTLIDYQRHQLEKFETSTSTSRWMESSAGPVDGTYIKDLTVAIMDVDGGAFLHAPGTSVDGQFRIPNDGVAYVLSDFRVAEDELPENHCTPTEWKHRTESITDGPLTSVGGIQGLVEDQNVTRQVKIDGDQWCYRYRLQDLSVQRSLWLGDRLLERWNGTSAGVSHHPYSIDESTRSGLLRITVDVSITEVTIEQHRDWNRHTGWQVASESRSETRSTTRVADSKQVFVSTNQQLSVRQRVVDLESDRHVVVLEFVGPPELEDRRIWSRAIFDDDQELQNVWGVYSMQAPHRGWATSNADHSPRPYHFPTILRLHATSRSKTPLPRVSALPTRDYQPPPEIIQYRRHQLGTVPFNPGPGVMLTTHPVYRYDALVVATVPGEVTEVLDIHGDPIPLETHHSKYRETKLTVIRINDSTAELRLVETEDGAGLEGRKIHLSGTLEETIRTNERGVAIVHPTRRFVTAEFRGDGWLRPQSVYHGPAQDTARIEPAAASLMGSIIEFAHQLSSVGVVVVLAILGWLWSRSR